MPGPRLVVDGPVHTPTPYGLASVVQWRPVTDPHVFNGITYESICPSATGTYDECIAVTGVGGAPPPPTHWPTLGRVFRGGTSFTVLVEFDCSAVGVEDARGDAERALAISESWQLERAFWTGQSDGQVTVFPHLAANTVFNDPNTGPLTVTLQTAATVVSGAGDVLTGMVEQIGVLEGALADCYNGVGVLHIPQHAAATIGATGLLKANGPVMTTLAGNQVAIGAGYPGTSPAGATRAADRTWIYATGSVFGYRSDVRVRAPGPSNNFDRSTNTRKMIAERRYVLGWECCHFAVNPALGTPKGT